VEPYQPGRGETLRYHQEFYRDHRVFEPGSWLYRPSPFVLRSLNELPRERSVVVYDLGCGVGRHTIPIARAVAAGSQVIGMDLLPIAATQLEANAAAAGVSDKVQAVVADLELVTFPTGSADLMVGCSALEHVSSFRAFEELLGRLQVATRVGGLHCLVIGSDKYEVDSAGVTRPALVEFRLSTDEVTRLLHRRYADWTWLENSRGTFTVDESRDGAAYQLHSTCVRLLARRTCQR